MNTEGCPNCQGSATLAGSVGNPGYMTFFVPRNMNLLFGWSPKEKEPAAAPELLDHPMRDRLLDG